MAIKKIDVSSPPQLTAEVTAGADVTISHFRFTDSEGVPKTKWKALTASRTLSAGGRLSLNDEAFSVSLTGDLVDNAGDLDAKFVNGDKIGWSTDGVTATARLAATAITWAAASGV